MSSSGSGGPGAASRKAASNRIPLPRMKHGRSGRVAELIGGRGLIRNLRNLGIGVGTEIRVVSRQLMHGPVIISKNRTQVAIGYGMARRIIVEPLP